MMVHKNILIAAILLAISITLLAGVVVINTPANTSEDTTNSLNPQHTPQEQEETSIQPSPRNESLSSNLGEGSLYQVNNLGELLEVIETQPLYTSVYDAMVPGVALPVKVEALAAEQAPAQGMGQVAADVVFYTGTNVQVEGVDELDWIKTNGTHVFAIHRSPKNQTEYLLITRVYPPEEAGVVLRQEIGKGREHSQGLFLVDERIIVVKQSFMQNVLEKPQAPGSSPTIVPGPYLVPLTIVETYQPGEGGSLEKTGSFNITGRLMGARLLGDGVVLVVQLQPYVIRVLPEPLPFIDNKPLSLDRILVSREGAESYTTVVLYNATSGEIDYKSILTPPVQRIYLSSNGTLYVFAVKWPPRYIPLDPGLFEQFLPQDIRALIETLNRTTSLTPGQREALIRTILESALSTLPVDEKRLVYQTYANYVENLPKRRPLETTVIFKALITSGGIIVPNASTTVPGTLLDQFAVHENRDGVLIIATTSNIVDGYQIAPLDDYLVSGRGIPPAYPIITTVNNVFTIGSDLRQLGSLEGLAPTERIYSARYIGDFLFLVTFRQVDPLLAINLTDPAKPQLVGELKIPGYSEYLHPLGQGLILGVGMQTDDRGRPLGVKINLLNVSDPLNPRQLDEIVIKRPEDGWVSSPVLTDHRAFTVDYRDKTVYIPIRSSLGSWVLVISIDGDALEERGRLYHVNVIRTIIVEDMAVTASPQSLKLWQLNTLSEVWSLGLD